MLRITQIPKDPVVAKQAFSILGVASTDYAGKRLTVTVDGSYQTQGPVVPPDGNWRVVFMFQQAGNRRLAVAIGQETAETTIKVVATAPPPPRPPRLRFTNVPASVQTEQMFSLEGQADNYVDGAQLVLRVDRKYELARPRVQAGKWQAPVFLHEPGRRSFQIIGSEQDWAEITLDVRSTPTHEVQVMPRSSWTNQPTPTSLPTLLPQRITLHHTDLSGSLPVNASKDQEAQRMRLIWSSHVNGNGWSDIGYHFIIMPSGRVYEARSERKRGAHDVVNDGLGIAFDGKYTSQTISNQQFQAAVALCTELCKRYGINDPVTPVPTPTADFGTRNLPRICGHRDRVSTACPGSEGGKTVRLPDIRKAVKERL